MIISELLRGKYEHFIRFTIIILFVFSICLVGFRYQVGTDYATYETWFHLWYDEPSIEWIYAMLNYWVKISGGQFYYVTFFMAIWTHSFVLAGIRKWGLKNEQLVLGFVIFCSSYMFYFMNGMRQGAAVAVFLFASYFIVERKFWKYLFWLIIAAGFHISILIVLPLYWLPHLKIKNSVYIGAICIAYIIVATGIAGQLFEVLLNASFYNAKYESILTGDEDLTATSSSLFSPGILVSVVSSVVLLSFREGLPSKYNVAINFYMIGMIIQILAISTYMYNRLGMYFQVFNIICSVVLLKNIQEPRLRFIAHFFFYVILFVVMYKVVIYSAEEGNFIYKNIFSERHTNWIQSE